MSNDSPGPFDHLVPHVHASLAQNEAGMTEFQLLQSLRGAGLEPFASAQLDDPLSLFRTHFILFHCLYRLQDRLRLSGFGLDVHCLRVAIVPVRLPQGDGPHPDILDPLRAYYLNLDTLRETNEDDVVAMLAGGWGQLDDLDRRQKALAVLGLRDPVEFREVKQRYRRLVMRHHPDRGGDNVKLQKINEAFDLLRNA